MCNNRKNQLFPSKTNDLVFLENENLQVTHMGKVKIHSDEPCFDFGDHKLLEFAVCLYFNF